MLSMTREEEIITAARERADRHQIAEMELYAGDKCNYSYGRIYNSEIVSFEAGVKYADKHPKSPWINAKDDLPCNHKELIIIENTCTKRVIVFDGNDFSFSFMIMIENKWYWHRNTKVKYWMQIPELPKE